MRAIFAGTFDPFTSGHRNIVLRARDLFGAATVAVADSERAHADIKTRVDIARLSLADADGINVEAFDGLLTDYVAAQKEKCVLVRGVRSVKDHEYERELDAVYKSLANVESVYFMTLPHFAHISSTIVRELASLGAPLGGYVERQAMAAVSKYYGN